MKRIALLFLLLSVGRSGVAQAPADTGLVFDAPADSFVQIAPPSSAALMWKYVELCSGRTVTPLPEITWISGPLRKYDPQHLIIAHWQQDTIMLDNSYPLWNVTIAHELLHQLLGGPGGVEAHPAVFDTCKLMPAQNPDKLSARVERETT